MILRSITPTTAPPATHLDEMTDAIDIEMEDKQEEIENNKEKLQKKELRKQIRSYS